MNGNSENPESEARKPIETFERQVREASKRNNHLLFDFGSWWLAVVLILGILILGLAHFEIEGQWALVSAALLVLGLYGHRSLRAAQQLQKDVAHLQVELHRWATFLNRTGEVAGVGAWEVDLRNMDIFWTDQTKRIHGVPPDYKPCLKTAIEFYAPEAREAVERAVREGMEEGKPWDLELPFDRADGVRIWVRAAGQAEYGIAPDDRGKVVRLHGIFQDITARRKVEAELREMNDHLETATLRANEMALQAQLASAAKSEFLASMSHEIRTPMNGILGFTHLLMETPMTEEQRDFTLTLQRSGEALLTLINDILDYSKIEAGKLSLEIVTIDLRNGCAEAVELMAAQARSKDLELVLDGDPEPLLVSADPCRVRQILFNLIGNALKFTRKGHVLVRLENVAAIGRAPGMVKVSITDTGIGIPADKQGFLFNKFVQADVSTSRKFGGTGLGLAICKQLVEMMGGSIGLDSAPGKGSTFWFTLPISKGAPANDTQFFRAAEAAVVSAVVPAGKIVPSPTIAALKVLVIVSHEATVAALTRTLAFWKMKFEVASDTATGWLKLREGLESGAPYPVVLLDERLLGCPGEDWDAELRNVCGRDLPYVVHLRPASLRGGQASVNSKEGHVARTALVLPLTRPVALLDALHLATLPAAERLLREQNTERYPLLPSPRGNGGEETASTLDTRASQAPIRVLLAEDNVVNQKLAIRLLTKCGCEVDVAVNGFEAMRFVSERAYQIIFMDCQMPDMDGFEATVRLRKREAELSLQDESRQSQPRLPIVALTANAMEGDRERCLRAGMDDYLTKPLKADELRAAVQKWMAVVPVPITLASRPYGI